jgi:hypothetical protein
MTFATRTLTIVQQGRRTPVPVVIHQPQQHPRHWECAFEIGWPVGTLQFNAKGADGMQAVYLAMQAIAIRLYSSPYHAAGELVWDKPGDGYGFPMPKPGYPDLIGEDRIAQVP